MIVARAFPDFASLYPGYKIIFMSGKYVQAERQQTTRKQAQ